MYFGDKIAARSFRYGQLFAQGALDKVEALADRLVEGSLGRVAGYDDTCALIAQHAQAIEGDAKAKAAFARAYMPILNNDHLIISNIFVVGSYLSADRFEWFKRYLRMSSFGERKHAIQHALIVAGLDPDSAHLGHATSQNATPSAHIASIVALFFALFASAEGDDPAKAEALLARYEQYWHQICQRCLGIEYDHADEAGQPGPADPSDRFVPLLDKLMYCFMRSVIEEHGRTVSPFHRMCAIFSEKSSYASMHHNNVCVNGVNLAETFADENFDSARFSREMLESHWFDRDNPDQSRFFKKLTAFGKPMFGVFSDAELAELTAGVSAPQDDSADSFFRDHAPAFAGFVDEIHRDWLGQRPSTTPDRTFDLRAMYHALVNRQHDADIDAQCLSYLQETIENARNMDVARQVGPEFLYFRYSKDSFAAKLDAIYKTQMDTADSVNYVDIDRDTLRNMHLTYAPTAFIDGCWLENVPKILRHEPGITRVLFDIYYDELGSGEYKYNHARIYEDLIDDLDIDLPAPNSWEFAQHPQIFDAAFRTPVFMLAMGRYIDDLFPEMLGFTLSTELFGLGGFYQYLMGQLQKNDIDANFYSIHISVDNLSSGHSAMAAKSVMNFMESAADLLQSKELTDAVWRRVWDGFMASRYLLK